MSTPQGSCSRTSSGALVANPDVSLASPPGLSEAERHRILVDWNDTRRPYPGDRCLHRLFEERVEVAPEAVALVCGDRSLTYRELNVRANRLGHRLRSIGVGPETLVGLFAERSLEMVVGLLGILKAGGAYVPLDPDYPAGRLASMLEDARPAVVLAQEHLEGRLPRRHATVVCLDRDAGACHDDANLESGVGPRNLAYVMYTSGTIGEPKGVLIENRSVVRLVCGVDYATFGLDRVFLQLAPAAFDAFNLRDLGRLVARSPAGVGARRSARPRRAGPADRGPGRDHDLADRRPVQRDRRFAPLDPRGRAGDPHGRRGAVSRACPDGLPGDPRAAADHQRLWPDREHDVRLLPSHRPDRPRGPGQHPDRPADRQYAGRSPRRRRAAGPRGSSGRAVPGRRRAGAGLPQPSRGDGRAIRGGPRR